MTSTTAPTGLDDATLRQLFPDAPADLSVPDDVRSILRARLASFRQRFRWLVVLWWGALAGSVAMALLGQYVAGGAVAFAALLGALIVYVTQRQRAEADFVDSYAAARGLEAATDVRMSQVVPLLTLGDQRRCAYVLRGMIAGAVGELAHYTWTDVSTDSNGNRSETHHNFTILRVQVPEAVAARFAGVDVSPAGWLKGGDSGSLDGGRKVQFESAAFHDRFRVRVAHDQDDIALYELFSTTFLEQLSNDVEVYWQQLGQELVFWVPDHRGSAHELDAFCHDAARVLQRYREEHR